MKFICFENNLEKVLLQAEAIISTRPTIPILKNILLKAEGNTLDIRSTDLDIGYRSQIPVEVQKEGGISIQAKKLVDIVKSFPGMDICFDLDKESNRITICAEKREVVKAIFKVFGIGIEEYPKLESLGEEAKVFSVGGSVFKKMIKKVIQCVAKDESRYYLNGVFFEKKGMDLNCVATDGKRLGFIGEQGYFEKESVYKDFGVIVPNKALREVGKILEENGGDCEIAMNETMIFFRMGETEVVSNLLEGKFPEYEKVVPKDFNYEAKIQKEAISGGIERVSKMIDPKELKIRFSLSKGELCLRGQHVDFGEVKDIVNCEIESSTELAFNYKYLLEAIKEIEGEEVFFLITKEDGPVLIRGEEESFFYIVMPMRLGEQSGNLEGGESGDVEGTQE